MQQGALKEVRSLVARNFSDSLPAMRALGVQELKTFLNGETTLEEAVELAKLHTRQYAKRQSTWFNNRFSPDLVFPGCFGAGSTADNFGTKASAKATGDTAAPFLPTGGIANELITNSTADSSLPPGGIARKFRTNDTASENFVDEVVDNLKKRYKMLAK